MLLPLGLLLGIGGSVAGIVTRNRVEEEGAARGHRLATAALAVAAIAVVTSGALALTGRERVDPAATGGSAVATMAQMAFTEGTVEIAAGAPADVLVRNDDAVVHTFTVPELGIDQTVGPGSDALVEVTADPGSYTFYCKPHANLSEPNPARAGMAGTLVAT